MSPIAHHSPVGNIASEPTLEIVFWQRIVSIHQAAMIAALAATPGVEVTYVAEEMVPDNRRSLGWDVPSLGAANLVLVSSPQAVEDLVLKFSAQTIHICQGIRDNGIVGFAEKLLRQRNARVVLHMETLNDIGLIGLIRRFWYGISMRRAKSWADSVLAIGEKTPLWFSRRGFPRSRVFEFSYFLDPPSVADARCFAVTDAGPFHVGFVGSFIPLKRLDLLIDSLAIFSGKVDFKLTVIGSGPLEDQLRQRAVNQLGAERVAWEGLIHANRVSSFLVTFDVLVLPSLHDGWGAVVSEALLVGTPAICSDHCGAAFSVRQSRAGGVFRSGDGNALAECLLGVMRRGIARTSERTHLAAWAWRTLGATAGAHYLVEILRHRFAGKKRPLAPLIHPRY